MKKCPNPVCGYIRQPEDDKNHPPDTCPECYINYEALENRIIKERTAARKKMQSANQALNPCQGGVSQKSKRANSIIIICILIFILLVAIIMK